MASRPLNAALAADTSGIDGSSLDELAMSKFGAHTPLAPKSTNTRIQNSNFGATPKFQSSPAKSIYYDTPGGRGSSPVRLKITVETVDGQEDGETPSKRSLKTNVIKVPLKDADEPVVAKRKRGRPRKSDVGTPAVQANADPSAIKMRKGTPMRRLSKRLSGSSEGHAEPDDPSIGLEASPPKKRPGRPRKSLPQPNLDKEPPSPKKKTGRPRKIVTQLETGPDVAPLDEEDAPTEDYQPSPSIAERSETSAVRTKESLPTTDTPSVGQSPDYHENRRRLQEPRPIESSAGTRRIRKPRPIDSDSSHHRVASAEMPSRPESSRLSQIDFTKLTPLHEKHSIAPMQPIYRHMPARSTPRPKSDADIVLNRTAGRYSPTNAGETLRRNPFSERSISPITTHEPLQARRARSGDSTPPPPQFRDSPPAERTATASPQLQPEEQQEDEEMWRRMIPDRVDDGSTDREATPASDSDESDYEELGEVTGRPMGEATLMQSEEFSMVSLDSLESVRDPHSSFVGDSRAGNGDRSLNESQQVDRNVSQQPTSSKLKQAWLPGSSPAAHLSPNVSVQRGRQSPRPLSSPYPPRRPSQNRQSSPQNDSRQNENRPLGAHLSLGELESSPVGAAPTSSFLIPHTTQSPVNVSSPPEVNGATDNDDLLADPPLAPPSANGRLPTPNSADKESLNTGSSPFEVQPSSVGQQNLCSTLLEPDQSPLKSDSEASMQSHTPPLTPRGSSPVVNHGRYLANNTISPSVSQQLPSSPPNRIASSSGLAETKQWRLKQKALERTWNAAKKQLSPPSQRQNRPIDIPSDHSYSDDSEGEEEEPTKNTEGAAEEDISDLWQEEASRSSNVDDSDLSKRPRHADGNVKRKLFSNTMKPPSPRLTKVPRTTKPFSASPKQNHRIQSKDQPSDFEHERLQKNSSAIADLFKNVTGTSGDPGVGDNSNPSRVVERSLPQSGLKGKNKAEHDVSAPSSHREFPPPSKPTRSSQLKPQLTPETESSFGNQNDSFVSMASDVRQLCNDMTMSQKAPPAKKQPAPPQASSKQIYSTGTTTQKVPVNMRSIDDSTESEHEKYDNSSLLSLHPKQPVKPLFRKDDLFAEIAEVETQEPKKKPAAVRADHRAEAGQSKPAQKQKSPEVEQIPAPAPAPSIFGRVWSNLPSIPFMGTSIDQSENGPPRPKHRLLADLMLLPRTLPFTKTHYRVMEQLWMRYKQAPELFLTSHRDNAGLMTQSLSKFADVTMSEWNYEAQLKPSSLILVALFMRLLVLKDANEFEAIEGNKLELGVPGRCWLEDREQERASGKTAWRRDELEITEAFCVMRLFSLMVCESVREDEEKGILIDRGLPFKWKLKGERGWNFTLLVSE